MKKTIIILAALAAVVACNKAETTDIKGDTINLVAEAGVDETKVHFGELTTNKYPYEWDAEEVVGLDEFCAAKKSQEVASVSYTKTSSKNASFGFTLGAKTTEGAYTYVAVVPANSGKNANHGWRGYKDGNFSYILNHTLSQKPLADGPDPTTHIMYAKYEAGEAQAKSLELNFQPLVAYGKMTVKNLPALASGETVTSITISVSGENYMRGRINQDISTGAKAFFGNSTKINNVVIDPENITVNTTGFDVWFTTLPLELAAEDAISLEVATSVQKYTANIELSKALKFEAGKVSAFVYDYEKGQPKKETKTLTFDFSTCPAGWPTGSGTWTSSDVDPVTLPYVLDKTTYNFIASPCTGATQKGWAWGYNSKAAVEFFCFNTQRFLGLPALEGYKLITVKYVQMMGTNTSRKAGITAAISALGGQEYISGGELKVVGTNGEEYSFNLTKTAANTVYYIAAVGASSGIATLKLTYEKVD